MNHGLSSDTVAAIHRVLRLHPAVEKAVLYGSRAMGNYKPGSDIDLTLFGDALNTQELMNLDDELDDLLLPYRIDLSIRRQINNESLLNHIERMGILFYVREREEALGNIRRLL